MKNKERDEVLDALRSAPEVVNHINSIVLACANKYNIPSVVLGRGFERLSRSRAVSAARSEAMAEIAYSVIQKQDSGLLHLALAADARAKVERQKWHPISRPNIAYLFGCDQSAVTYAIRRVGENNATSEQEWDKENISLEGPVME